MQQIILKLVNVIFLLFFFNTIYSQSPNIKFNNSFTKAQIFYLKSDYNNALKEIEKCISLKPNSSTVYFLGSKIYSKKNDYSNSLSYISKAINLDSNNLDFYRFLFNLNKKFSYIQESEKVLNKLLLKSKNYLDYYQAIIFYDSINDITKLIKTINLTELNFGSSETLDYYKYNIYRRNSSIKALSIAKFILYKYHFNNQLFNYITSYYFKNNNIDTLKFFVDSLKLFYNSINFDIYYSLIEYNQFVKNSDSSFLDSAIFLFTKVYKTQDPIFLYKFINSYNNFINPLNFNFIYDSIVNYILPYINYSQYSFFSNQYSKYNRFCNQIYILEKETQFNYSYYEALKLASLYLRFSYWYKLDSLSSFYLKIYPLNSKFYLFKAIALLNSNTPQLALNYLNTGKQYLFNDSLYKSYFDFFTSIYYLTVKDTDNYEEYLSQALEYQQSDFSNIIFFSLYLAQTQLNNNLALKIISECVLQSPDSLPSYLSYVYSYVLFNNKDYKNSLTYINNSIKNSKYPNFTYFYLKYKILLHFDNNKANLYYELSQKYGNFCL